MKSTQMVKKGMGAKNSQSDQEVLKKKKMKKNFKNHFHLVRMF